MTGWKIHHEWRCISYWKFGFSNAMLVFRGEMSPKKIWTKTQPETIFSWESFCAYHLPWNRSLIKVYQPKALINHNWNWCDIVESRKYTLKTKISPENWWLKDEMSFEKGPFSGDIINFRAGEFLIGKFSWIFHFQCKGLVLERWRQKYQKHGWHAVKSLGYQLVTADLGRGIPIFCTRWDL